jgi:hypothetical protein
MKYLVLLLCGVFATNVYALSTDLRTFLRDRVELSEKELQQLEHGRVLTKLLDSEKKPEVAVFGVMHVDVPVDFFVEKYRDIETFMRSVQIIGIGKFDNPPQLNNLRKLTLDPDELLAIKECKVGDCKMKLPASVIERFGQELDWSNPNCQEKATELVKQMLFEYVKIYLAGGNRAMGQYDDQKYPLRLADEFHELLQESSYLYDYVPEFHEYLENYPQGKRSDVEDFIYWSEKKYEKLRPIVSLNHVTIFRRPQGRIKDLIASKQIYASHYFEASFELAALVKDDGDTASSGFYLLYLNRSRIDTLRKNIPSGMKHTIRSEILSKVDQELKSIKAGIENLYQYEKLPGNQKK